MAVVWRGVPVLKLQRSRIGTPLQGARAGDGWRVALPEREGFTGRGLPPDSQRSAQNEKAAAKAALLAGGAVLGILSDDPVAWLSKSDSDSDGLTSEVIDQMLIDRAEAKANRDFSRADAIRDELNAAGIIIEDSASGVTWRRG